MLRDSEIDQSSIECKMHVLLLMPGMWHCVHLASICCIGRPHLTLTAHLLSQAKYGYYANNRTLFQFIVFSRTGPLIFISALFKYAWCPKYKTF